MKVCAKQLCAFPPRRCRRHWNSSLFRDTAKVKRGPVKEVELLGTEVLLISSHGNVIITSALFSSACSLLCHTVPPDWEITMAINNKFAIHAFLTRCTTTGFQREIKTDYKTNPRHAKEAFVLNFTGPHLSRHWRGCKTPISNGVKNTFHHYLSATSKIRKYVFSDEKGFVRDVSSA